MQCIVRNYTVGREAKRGAKNGGKRGDGENSE